MNRTGTTTEDYLGRVTVERTREIREVVIDADDAVRMLNEREEVRP